MIDHSRHMTGFDVIPSPCWIKMATLKTCSSCCTLLIRLTYHPTCNYHSLSPRCVCVLHQLPSQFNITIHSAYRKHLPDRYYSKMQSILRMPRSTTVVKLLCPSLLGARASIASRTSAYRSRTKRYSHQSYGSNDNPQGHQPASRKSRELEHPGILNIISPWYPEPI